MYITGYALFRHIFLKDYGRRRNGNLLVCVAIVIYIVDIGKYELSVHIIYFWICVIKSYMYITGYALFTHIFLKKNMAY